MKIIKLIKSPRKNKRFRVYLDNGEHYDFGLLNPVHGTYIDHKNKELRENYRARHLGNDIERHVIKNLIPSPSLYSYFLLWGDSTDLKKNIDNLNKKYL